jgi:hypothetical protein
MRERPLKLIQILENPIFQFWAIFVVVIPLYILGRRPSTEDLLELVGISLAGTFGILGVIAITDHFDNPLGRVGIWLKAFVSSVLAFCVFMIIAPYAFAFFLFPSILISIPVIQGFGLRSLLKEDFGRCFLWAFGGVGLTIIVLCIGVWIWSGSLPVVRIGR